MTSSQRAFNVQYSGALFTLAGMMTLLVVTISEALFPNYSVHSNTISDLAAIGAPTAPIEDAEGLFRAFCLLAGGYLLFRRTGKRGQMTLFLLPGIGMLFATLSPENFNVTIHSIGAVITFFGGVATMVYSYRIVRSPFRYLSVFLGLLSLTATLVLFLGYNAPIVQQTLGPGGWERVIAYPILIWLVGFGSYLLASAKSEEMLQ